ncbi:hypothetical protein [Pedobacter cryoconitis]|uniref:hypothetical protein n=1 Tax=Pedobacter cryoconitis TaxID=188932 RepID=UPI00160A1077|nr:hypothetical protein [Pedobacter cryoconitis]MBB5647182.1 thymidylate kinase [Pedobacter cryoconitis]
MHPDIEVFIQSLRQLGVSVNLNANLLTSRQVSCYYICNTDGSIRWIWPATSRHADFIKFYHHNNFRTILFVTVAIVLAKTGMLSYLTRGSFSLYTTPQHASNNRWAWFSGTIGPGRKAILWHLMQGSKTGSFFKIPIGPLASDNIRTEAKQLKYLGNLYQSDIVLPQSAMITNSILKITDIGCGTYRTNRFNELPFHPVKNWLQTDLTVQRYQGSALQVKLNEMISKLSTLNDHRIPNQILGKIEILIKNISIPLQFVNSHSHGDFTPWNVMIKDKKLHIIDLELSCSNMPVLFDLFHFVYQSNILIGNNGYASIRKELDLLFINPLWNAFLQEHQINSDTAETLYLLYTVAYYLNVYAQQPKWHTQVNWLLRTWDQALSLQLQKHRISSARKIMLKDLGQLLSTKKYAVLKWMYEEIETLPEDSDIDICITRNGANELINELKSHPLISKIIIVKKSFMAQLEIVCLDGSLIHVDLIHTFKRKAFVFLSATALLDNTKTHRGGLKIPSPEEDAEYIRLFYLLNHTEIPERYQPFFDINFSFPVKNYSKEFQRGSQNKGWKKCLHLFNYYMDTLKSSFSNNGFIITFSGVDGAGKSTVIANMHRLIDKKLRRKVIIIRHRPGLLPIISSWKYGKVQAEHRASNTLPRLGKNYKKWSSILRFSYYYIDYLIGQWYIQLRYVSQGYIVLYDRYYFDFINDAKRSNIVLSSSFTGWWYKFLIQPKLNFFLYADEKLILERKQELDGPTIRRLTKSYLKLFSRLKRNSASSLYIPLENLQLSNTLSEIFTYIKLKHDESYN